MRRGLIVALILMPIVAHAQAPNPDQQLVGDWQTLTVDARNLNEAIQRVQQDLIAKINADTTEKTALEKQIADLKTKCGDACKEPKKENP